MESSLREIFKEATTKGKENFLSLDPIQKFCLSEKFWSKFDSSFNKDQINFPISLLEIPQHDYSILRFDIDIYVETPERKRLYDQKLVTDIVRHVHFLIEDTAGKECDIDIKNPNHLICCVFEKDEWIQKDGFHLVFPNLFVRHDFQDCYFVTKLQQYIQSNNPLHIVVDRICKKPWVVLGCRKKCESSLYKLTSAYDKNLNLVSTSKFSPSSFSINKISTVVYGKTTIRPVIKKDRLPLDIDKDYELIVEWGLLNKLSIKRAEEYDSWIEIGIVLYNIGCGEERFLDLWKEFSSRCTEKFDPNVCERKWRTFSSRNITIRSLFYYFKQDDPYNFDKMVYHQNINKVYQGLFPSEGASDQLKSNCVFENYHIAKIFHSKYCNDYVWAPSKGKVGSWYTFDGNRWIHIYEEFLRGKINGELCEYINELFDQIKLDRSSEDDDKVSKYLDNNQTNLTRKLNNVNFVKQIVEASKSLFINQFFHKNLDANKYLLGCENGVLDMDRQNFRRCSPDDFVSMSTGIYYEEPSIENLEELDSYFEDLFVDKELSQNVLEIIASLLVGSNDDKNIIIALGPTNAGKTQLVKLFEKALGDYAMTFPKELVYQRTISSSAARPELARVEGKRIAFINELSKDERMNVATVKELSGNDKFYARKLYADGGEITPMFTMYLSCNEVPRIPQDDEALWGRLLIINFESTFVNYAPECRDVQLAQRKFPRIPNLEEKFVRLAPTLLWVLFNKYIENKQKYPKGIPKCSSIRKATEKFRESNNPVFKFIQERITISPEGAFFKCTDLFTYYSNWYKSYFPEQKIRINKDQFKESFVKHSGLSIVKEKSDEHSRKTEGWTNIIFGEKTEDEN
jgi:P4 family phage/plasmid primase-like protien